MLKSIQNVMLTQNTLYGISDAEHLLGVANMNKQCLRPSLAAIKNSHSILQTSKVFMLLKSNEINSTEELLRAITFLKLDNHNINTKRENRECSCS